MILNASHLILLLISFTAVSPSWALALANKSSEICELKPMGGTPVAHRSQSITFPYGRRIIIVGHNHGDRGVPKKLKELYSSQTKISKHDLLSRLSEILVENKDAIRDAKQDLVTLKLLLSKNQLQFTAVEDGPDAEKFFNFAKAIESDKKLKIEQLNLPHYEQFEEASLLMFGESGYLADRHPEMFRSALVVGIESPQAIANERALYAVTSKIRKEIYTKLESNKPIRQFLAQANFFFGKRFIKSWIRKEVRKKY